MNLVIDSGNSAAKVGIFDHEKLVEKFSFPEVEKLQSFLRINTFQNLIVSSVKADAGSILSWAAGTERKFTLKQGLPLPLRILYETPHTLGMDRLAGVCGAIQLFPGQNNLVIDTGTCITYDFVDKERAFHGGGISPGLNMRFQAVHTFTAKLPLVSPKAGVELVGKTTETSIQSGIVNGLLAELEGTIRLYKEKFPGLQVILCGGDTGFFEKQLKASIFASPDLVLIGLNSILIYNVNHS
jgi:type III pantothenate kinase